jgi:tRNA pseudouridine55 synthase
MNGVLIVDKPAGLTSHDVVNRLRRILQQRSVGHLGTLDPMATGVLPMVMGNLTRLAQFYTNAEKTYEGTIRFGFATDTYDAEGNAATTPLAVTLSFSELQVLAEQFRGSIEQTPPPFSAKKIHGVPAYKLARKRKDVVLKPVQVEIKEFELLAVEGDRARFRAHVASGTYLRCVAHDMGQRLGCGAHLESLRRIAVAEFTLHDAHTLEEISNHCQAGLRAFAGSEERRAETTDQCRRDRSFPFAAGSAVEGPCASASTLEDLFIHPRKLLPQLPSVTADDANTARIRTGRNVNLPELSRAQQVKVFSGQRELIAIATRVAGTLFHPRIVLCVEDAPPGVDP